MIKDDIFYEFKDFISENDTLKYVIVQEVYYREKRMITEKWQVVLDMFRKFLSDAEISDEDGWLEIHSDKNTFESYVIGFRGQPERPNY